MDDPQCSICSLANFSELKILELSSVFLLGSLPTKYPTQDSVPLPLVEMLPPGLVELKLYDVDERLPQYLLDFAENCISTFDCLKTVWCTPWTSKTSIVRRQQVKKAFRSAGIEFKGFTTPYFTKNKHVSEPSDMDAEQGRG